MSKCAPQSSLHTLTSEHCGTAIITAHSRPRSTVVPRSPLHTLDLGALRYRGHHCTLQTSEHCGTAVITAHSRPRSTVVPRSSLHTPDLGALWYRSHHCTLHTSEHCGTAVTTAHSRPLNTGPTLNQHRANVFGDRYYILLYISAQM